MKIDEKTGLYENYGLWHVPFWQTETFYFIIKITLVIATVIVCIALYKLYAAYKKRKKLPAWQCAVHDLQKLHDAQQHSFVEAKEFYASLGSIVKIYLHNRFGYDVLSKTDDEVVEYLQKRQMENELIEDVRALLQGSIFIKFANGAAAQEQMNNDYERALFMIKKTIPQKNK